MEMKKVLRATLNKSLFCGGKNFGERVEAHQAKMLFDEMDKTLFVFNNKEVVRVLDSDIATLVLADQKAEVALFDEAELAAPPKTHIHHASRLNMPGAQISDPTTIVQNPRKGIKQ